MDGQRHDFRALLALGIKPVELIDGAPHQIFALMMLDDHHRDVVELERIGQGEQGPVGGADDGRLVVIDPVADIFDAGAGEDFRRVEGFRQPGTEPAERPFAGEALDDAERALDHRLLIRLGVDRALLVGMAHEFPAVGARLFGDTRIVLADAGIERQRRADAASA